MVSKFQDNKTTEMKPKENLKRLIGNAKSTQKFPIERTRPENSNIIINVTQKHPDKGLNTIKRLNCKSKLIQK